MLQNWLGALGVAGQDIRESIVALVDYLLHWPQWLFAALIITYFVLIATGVLADTPADPGNWNDADRRTP